MLGAAGSRAATRCRGHQGPGANGASDLEWTIPAAEELLLAVSSGVRTVTSMMLLGNTGLGCSLWFTGHLP